MQTACLGSVRETAPFINWRTCMRRREFRLVALVLLAILLAAGGASHARAQLLPPETEETPKTVTKPRPASAEVVVFNRPIVEFRAPFLSQSPEERARRTKRNIEEVLARADKGEVTTKVSPQGYLVLLDGTAVLIVTPGDVDVMAGETTEMKARQAADALKEVVALGHEMLNPGALLRAVVRAGIATALLFVLWWILARIWSWLTPRLAAGIRAQAARHKEGGARAFARMVEDSLARLIQLRLGYRLLLLVLIFEWLSFVLKQFPYTRYWGERLTGFFIGMLAGIGGAIVEALPDLTVSIVIFTLAYFVHRLVKLFFRGVEIRQITLSWLEPETALATRRLVLAGVWIFAVVMAYPYLPGSSSQAFKGLSVLIGVMISLGSSSIVGQAASGLILMYTRTLKVGQYVRIADVEGTVIQLGMFATHISTGLDADITLPNSLVLSNVTKNYSRGLDGPGFVINTEVTIGYDTPWRQVEALLVEAARRTPGISANPEPRVFQIKLADFYPDYRLVCRGIPADPRGRAELLNALHANIQDLFNEHGVQIMSPHYFTDPRERKIVPKERWYAPPAKPPGQ